MFGLKIEQLNQNNMLEYAHIRDCIEIQSSKQKNLKQQNVNEVGLLEF